LVINGPEFMRVDAQFVAADAEGDDGWVIAAGRGVDDGDSGVGAELADGVEDPVHAQAALREGFSGGNNGREVGFRRLFAKDHDADGERDFSIDDIFGEEIFTEVASDQGVVFWVAEIGGDPFEGFEKAEEIFVGVEVANFIFGDDDAVSAGEGRGGGGLDGAFEVEVEFGFGGVGDGRREGCHSGRVAEEVASGEWTQKKKGKKGKERGKKDLDFNFGFIALEAEAFSAAVRACRRWSRR